jgi:MFS superfamily sulfate permease-like transporter
LLDLGATTDLDVPSADTLAELSEELHSHTVRLMLMHVIMPVRQMLESAGAMEKIRAQDVFIGPAEAIMDYFSSQGDEAGIQEMMRSGAATVVSLIQSGLPSAPAESQASLVAIMENLEKEIENRKTK